MPTATGTEGEMVPYNPRARRMSTVIASQRILPTEASTALPFMAQTIPEEGTISDLHLTNTCSLRHTAACHIAPGQSIHLAMRSTSR